MEHNSFEDTAREVGEGIAKVDQKGEPQILTKLELQNLGQTFENHDQTSASTSSSTYFQAYLQVYLYVNLQMYLHTFLCQ